MGVKITDLKENPKELILPKSPSIDSDEAYARKLMQEEEKQQQLPVLKKAHSEVDEATRKLIAQIQEMELMQ